MLAGLHRIGRRLLIVDDDTALRRMLTWMKAHVDGMRCLVYYVCTLFDEKEISPDPDRQKRAANLVELLTPVVKAYCAERGFEVCVQAVQVFGGYGYTREFPVEQLVRDTKIASIYEGTDGIQAMDLLGRKLGLKKGKPFMDLLTEMIDQNLQVNTNLGQFRIIRYGT